MSNHNANLAKLALVDALREKAGEFTNRVKLKTNTSSALSILLGHYGYSECVAISDPPFRYSLIWYTDGETGVLYNSDGVSSDLYLVANNKTDIGELHSWCVQNKVIEAGDAQVVQRAINDSNPLEKYLNDVGSGPTHHVALTFRDEEGMEQYGDVIGCMRVEDYDALANVVTETPIQISRKEHNIGLVLIPGEFPPEEDNNDWITMPDVITVWKEDYYLLFKAEYKGVTFIGHGNEVGPFEECENTVVNIAPGIYPKDLHKTTDYTEHKARWDEYAAIANAISDVDEYIPSKYVKKAFSKTLK